MRRLKISILFCFTCIILASCFSKQQDEHAVKKEPKRVIVNDFLLILGEDYYQREGILDYLKSEYGLGGDKSKITVLSHEDMLTPRNDVYLRSIYDNIKKLKSNIVIAIGAPEGSGRYFIKANQEFPEIVLVSLLPMEDVLPLEASCEIVVDYELPDDLLNDEKDFSVSDDDVELLLLSSVFAAENIVAHKGETTISPYNEFNRAFFTAQSILFKEKDRKLFRVKPYVDPETSLPSRKYLIIYEKKDNTETDDESSENTTSDTNNDESSEILNPDSLGGSP